MCFLTFGYLLANFARPVLGGIDVKNLQVNARDLPDSHLHFCTAPPSQIMQIAFILFAALVRKFNKFDVEVFGISALLYGEGHNLPDSSQIYAHFATTFF